MVGISYVIKWKSSRRYKLYLSGYGDKYGKFVLIGTALAGFYATVELITSHLWHLRVFSLHITRAQYQHIQTLRILNVVLLENLPQLLLQLLYLSSNYADERSANLTMITVMFSALSVVLGISNIITMISSRCITKLDQSDSFKQKLWIEFSLKESAAGDIKSYHVHSHHLLQRAMGISLHLSENQIVIYNIQRISNGLMVTAKLKFLSQEQVDYLQDELQNQQSEMRINMKTECTRILQINNAGSIELSDIKLQSYYKKNAAHIGSVQNNTISDIMRIPETIEMPGAVESPVEMSCTPAFQASPSDAGDEQAENTQI